MAFEPHESNSLNHARAVEAQRLRQIEATLVCPQCGERNRPGHGNHIELAEQDGWADCDICAHHFSI